MKTDINNLQAILMQMFPDLTPGEILFELDLMMEIAYLDWRQIAEAALTYAERYDPQFVDKLQEVLIE